MAAIYRLKQSKKRLSFKTRESMKVEEADLVSKLISGPSNFEHVSHMGPGDGLQILQDIPNNQAVRMLMCKFHLYINKLVWIQAGQEEQV